MSNYVFTYGTLLPKHAPAEIADAVSKLRPVGKGVVHGLLYDFGEYPGAVLDASSERKIFGTVFRLPDDPKVLRQLDSYEGFNARARSKSVFVRRLYPVTLVNGRKMSCWVYVYNREPGTAPILARGRYKAK